MNSGLIGISGAVKTIVALLRKPDNRSAAITCLGKTAELCVEQVRSSKLVCNYDAGVTFRVHAGFDGVCKHAAWKNLNRVSEHKQGVALAAYACRSMRHCACCPPSNGCASQLLNSFNFWSSS